MQPGPGSRVETDVRPVRGNDVIQLPSPPGEGRDAVSDFSSPAPAGQLGVIWGKPSAISKCGPLRASTKSSIAGPVRTNVSTSASSIDPNDCASRYLQRVIDRQLPVGRHRWCAGIHTPRTRNRRGATDGRGLLIDRHRSAVGGRGQRGGQCGAATAKYDDVESVVPRRHKLVPSSRSAEKRR